MNDNDPNEAYEVVPIEPGPRGHGPTLGLDALTACKSPSFARVDGLLGESLSLVIE
jgi:hypothetical protein